MKTTQYFLFLLTAMSGTALAAPRTADQARAIAYTLLSKHSTQEVQLQAVSCAQLHVQANGAQSLIPFYAFNNVAGKGFALISGSDLMPEVLGYADQGQFPVVADQLPVNMQSWLNTMAELESFLEQHPSLAAHLEHAQATQPVDQLLTTVWGQDAPFNDQCPVKKGIQTVTGCMATSISQVLNHQQFPTQMTGGTYSYNDHGTTRSVNFDDITIDYNLLLDNYSRGNGTEEERAEVAKLMVNVGHALNMQYDEQSGAISTMGLRGLVESIGCTKAQSLERKYYSLDEWNDLIQTELRANRPVVFDGFSDGGHSFVLDGVDAEGLYHVNWGWDGTSNGYYDVTILLPSIYGTGASASTVGFVYDQDIFVNVCDPANAGAWHTGLRGKSSNNISASKTSANVGDKVTFSTTVLNENPSAFRGYAGVVIYKENGELYDRAMSTTLTSIDATRLKSNRNGYYEYTAYGEKKISYSYAFPEMPDGIYKLYLCVQPEDSEEYDVIHVNHRKTSYRTLKVEGGKVTVMGDTPNSFVNATAWNFETDQLKTGPATITVDLVNDGDESLARSFELVLFRPDLQQLDGVQASTVTVAPGQTATVSFDTFLNLEGNWSAELYAIDPTDRNANYDLVDYRTFDVDLDPTRGAVFAVSKKLSMVTETLYSQGPVEFQLTVNNTGATYDGQMAVRLYSSKTSTAAKYLIAEIANDVAVPATTTQEIAISGEVNVTTLAAEKATLYARPYYLCGDEWQQLSSAVTQVTMYKGSSGEGIECIIVDQTDLHEAFDLMGRRVDHDNLGIKIVNGVKQINR